MNLYDTEKAFSSVLEQRVLDDMNIRQNFESLVSDNKNLPPQLAVEIYRNNSIGTRRRALQSIYPVANRIVGEECFTMLARGYMAACPSLIPDLNSYGSEFADFLASLVQREAVFADYAYLPDLARLEWGYHRVYYAADDRAEGAHNPEHGVSLKLSRSLSWLVTSYPVYAIWHGHQHKHAACEVEALQGEDYLVIFRVQDYPLIQRISADESQLLAMIDKHNSLEPVVELAVEQDIDVETLLPAMVQRGWLRILQGTG